MVQPPAQSVFILSHTKSQIYLLIIQPNGPAFGIYWMLALSVEAAEVNCSKQSLSFLSGHVFTINIRNNRTEYHNTLEWRCWYKWQWWSNRSIFFFALISDHPNGTWPIPGNILKRAREGICTCQNACRIETPHYEALSAFFIHFIGSVCVIVATHDKNEHGHGDITPFAQLSFQCRKIIFLNTNDLKLIMS